GARVATRAGVPSRLRASLTARARPVDAAAVDLTTDPASADAVVTVGPGANLAPSAADLAVAVGLAGLMPASADGAIAVGSDGTATAAEASLILGLGLTDPAPAAADAALTLNLGVDDGAPAAADAALAVGLGVDEGAPALPTLPDVPALPGAISSDGLLADVPRIGLDVGRPRPADRLPRLRAGHQHRRHDRADPGSTGTGQTGTSGVVPGPTAATTTRLAPLRPTLQAGPGGALPFTGDALDLLALVAMALLAAGGLFLRAVRPAPAGAKGGDRQSR
ncbi:MAG TPA: hypothetical protein VFL71_01655, partial [Actinomycetes bacterium]|nr:hypothetical protein [Actinomycetes bacterium]